MKLDLPTELLIVTLKSNSEISLLAATYAGNFDPRKNGKKFKAQLDNITDRQRKSYDDLIKQYAPELMEN